MAGQSDMLRQIEDRKARVGRLGEEARTTVIKDLADLEVRAGQGFAKDAEAIASQSRTRLELARETIARLPKELGQLTSDLVEELLHLGYTVEEVRSFTAWERILVWMGARDKAERSCLERLEQQSTRESVQRISELIVGTIEGLGAIEKEYETAVNDYNLATKLALQKLQVAQPRYESTRRSREGLEAAIKVLELELEPGAVDASARPAKEAELDILKRDYHDAHLLEIDLMVVLKVAEEAIKEVGKNRAAALEAIKAIHGMRRQLLEKQDGFSSILTNAMTGLKAAARIERFNAIDPSYNKAITAVTEMNVRVAGAATETFSNRLAKAAIDPETSLRLAQELAQSTAEFLEKLAAIAEEAEKAQRGEKASPDADTDILGGAAS